MSDVNFTDDLYPRYEKLLMERDELIRVGESYFAVYTSIFGELTKKLLRKKIDCLKLKRSIDYCQFTLNNNSLINYMELNEFVLNEIKPYENELKRMTAHLDSVKNFRELSESEITDLRITYNEISKLIHPDITTAIKNSKNLSDLWQLTVTAYHYGEVKELKGIELSVKNIMHETESHNTIPDIPDLSKKIEKLEELIKELKNTEPYTLKYFIRDSKAVSEKEITLKREIEEYIEEEKKLNQTLNTYLTNGIKFPEA